MAQTILLVEDDANTRTLFRMALQSAGYAVKEAADGLEAIGEAQMGRIDLILTDLDMPRIDGAAAIDTFAHMRQVRNIPILVATGSSEPAMKARALESGASEILSKPLAPEQLIAAVQRHLSAPRCADDENEA